MSFWGKGAKEHNRIERAIRDTKGSLWETRYSEVEEMLIADLEEKRKRIYKPAIPKKANPLYVYLPSDIDRSYPPYWKTAKPILQVDISTGEIVIDRLNEVEGSFACRGSGK